MINNINNKIRPINTSLKIKFQPKAWKILSKGLLKIEISNKNKIISAVKIFIVPS